MTDSEVLIKWLIDNKVMTMGFDTFLNEQTVEITEFGKEIHAILGELQTNSKTAEKSNILAAEKLKDHEADEKL